MRSNDATAWSKFCSTSATDNAERLQIVRQEQEAPFENHEAPTAGADDGVLIDLAVARLVGRRGELRSHNEREPSCPSSYPPPANRTPPRLAEPGSKSGRTS